MKGQKEEREKLQGDSSWRIQGGERVTLKREVGWREKLRLTLLNPLEEMRELQHNKGSTNQQHFVDCDLPS